MLNLVNKKVTILGGKRSGLALARLVVQSKGIAKISEQSTKEDFPKDFLDWAQKNNVELECKGHTQTFIEDSDVLVLSPGVRLDSKAVQWAKSKGIPVLGEIEFAFQFCSKPIIAVTGSNGKTTTVNLIYEVLKAAGLNPCLCGNVGTPFSEHVLNLKDNKYVVLEISSFQLESLLDSTSIFRRERSGSGIYINGFKPLIGVILNFNENHLDRHKDLAEYFDAKKRLFLNQDKNDYAVLNYKDERLKNLAKELPSKVVFFDEPQKIAVTTNPNHLAVLEVAKILNIESTLCQRVFSSFKGVEHRLELVRTINGVDFINDSKATTAEAGRWALKNIERPIVMICGGYDKKIGFSALRDLVKQKVKKMIVIGQTKNQLKETFQDVVSVDECDQLEAAVVKAKETAKQGECVVLCPMCASFDMFRDFEHRGKVFKEIVQKL